MPKKASHDWQPKSAAQKLTATEIRVFFLIQRLHEAAKNAETATAMLENAMGRFAGGVTQHYKRVLAERDAQIVKEIEERSAALKADLSESAEIIRQKTDGVIEHVERQFNKLLAAEDTHDLLHALALEILSSDALQEILSGTIQTAIKRVGPEKILKREAREVILDILIPDRNKDMEHVVVYDISNVLSRLRGVEEIKEELKESRERASATDEADARSDDGVMQLP